MSEEEKIEGAYPLEESSSSGVKVINVEEDSRPAEMAWYVINTFASKEKRVEADLKARAAAFHIEDQIEKIIVAEYKEPVYDENGKQKMAKDKETGKMAPKFKTKNYYPGYIFVKMIMTDENWFIVRNTPGVSGITGSSGRGAKPFPIPNEEMEPIMKRLGIEDASISTEYKIGDRVKILSGMFQDTEGTIEAIDATNCTVMVHVTMFGRTQEIPARFSEIEKADKAESDF